MPIQSATPIHDPLRPIIYNDPHQLLNNISETKPTSRLHDLAKHFRPVGHPSAVSAEMRKNHKVSEIELLATRCGDTVMRLDAGELGWIDLIRELPKLGCVTALTRNRHAVHKKTGTYRNGPRMDGGSCGTLRLRSSLHSPHLSILPGAQESREGRSNVSCVRDIRPSMDSAGWQSGFAVVEEINVGQHLTLRRGLQFFDPAGTVVHKIFLMEDSNHNAYEALVKHFTSADQSPEQRDSLVAKPLRQQRDSDIDIKGLRAYWHALRDARDFASGFNGMLERFGVLPIQALRLAGNDLAYRVAPTSFRQLMEILVARQCNGMSISVSVSSAGVTQTHTGLIRELNIIGPWLTIREPDFVLYLREDRIHTAWVVKKPSDDGMVTSLELYDARGENIAVLSAPCRPGQTWAGAWGGAMAILCPLEPM